VLKNLSEEQLYESFLDLDICQKAKDLVLKNKDLFTAQSYDCDIKTSLKFSPNILNCVEFHELKMNVLSHIEVCMHQKNLFMNGYIQDSWVNIYEKNFYQEFHVHNHPCYNSLSGVLYLSDKNSDIVFKYPNSVHFEPKFGNILLFPDNLPHRVRKNSEDDLRISIAFNFKFCTLHEIKKLS